MLYQVFCRIDPLTETMFWDRGLYHTLSVFPPSPHRLAPTFYPSVQYFAFLSFYCDYFREVSRFVPFWFMNDSALECFVCRLGFGVGEGGLDEELGQERNTQLKWYRVLFPLSALVLLTFVLDMSSLLQLFYCRTHSSILPFISPPIYTYIHTYIHTYTHTYIYTITRTYRHTHSHTDTQTQAHVCTRTHARTCTHVRTHTHKQTHTWLYTLKGHLERRRILNKI